MNSFLVFHAALENPYNNRACIAEYTVIVVSRKYRLYVSVCMCLSYCVCVCVVIISAEAGSLHISRVFALHSNPLSACPYIWVRLRIESDRANVLHPHEIIVAVRFHTYAPRAHSLRRCVLSFFCCSSRFSSYSRRLGGIIIIIIECGSGNVGSK